MRISLAGLLIGLGLAVTAAAARAPLSTRGAALDRVVAVVNDGVVLESELHSATEEVRARLGSQNVALPAEAVLRSQVLERLVLEEIQAQRAERAGVTASDEQVNQALEDIAIMRVLPNLVVLVPCDYNETKQATLAMAAYEGPAYLRMTREKSPVILSEDTPFVIGKHAVLRAGSDVTIVACGPLVYQALCAAETLAKRGIEAEVINASTIKPFDDKTLLKSIKKTGCAVTVEEHQVYGGLYGAVSEICAKLLPIPIEAIGMPDSFGESGTPEELLHAYGMTEEEIVKAAKLVIKRKR